MFTCRRVAFAALLLLDTALAWTPNHRPAKKPAKAKQPFALDDFRPGQWAAAGIMVASLAFATPLPTNAADAPPTGVQMELETNSLIKSIEENKGALNAAISTIVKDTPSESIKLDPPESKADAVREALNAGKEKEPPKEAEAPVEVVKEDLEKKEREAAEKAKAEEGKG